MGDYWVKTAESISWEAGVNGTEETMGVNRRQGELLNNMSANESNKSSKTMTKCVNPEQPGSILLRGVKSMNTCPWFTQHFIAVVLLCTFIILH